MGEVDERIAIPRRQTPRLKVPKGSVGIAGGQTGIYPLASPGGWQIIGRTDIELFTPNADSPCFFQPGDTVRFLKL
jgi:KipI family sensor histidine kinase inhibitor